MPSKKVSKKVKKVKKAKKPKATAAVKKAVMEAINAPLQGVGHMNSDYVKEVQRQITDSVMNAIS